MIMDEFVAAASKLRFENAFNPYTDRCPEHDGSRSPQIRLHNLRTYLEAAYKKGPRTAWVGRDLGYRGGRRTGLPLTDEANLENMTRLYDARGVSKATITPAVAERTAAEIWRVLGRIKEPPLLWNVVPVHPHEAGNPHSNRCHTRHEMLASAELLSRLLNIFRIEKVMALGNDAARALSTLGFSCELVRHPSYGGQTAFRAHMCEHYKISEHDKPEQGEMFT